MLKKGNSELWFITGSQHLYGEETLKQVADDSKAIAAALDKSDIIPLKVVFKPVLTTAGAITSICMEANNSPACAGLVAWMHTFSPAKMWIAGLKRLNKPMLHFHTQFNRDIPWNEIDMDFMNLNQSAHGDREFGFICSRLRMERKVVVGHWQDMDVLRSIGAWARAAMGALEARSLRVARFGDNMRDVAVTEGNKVSAQVTLDYEVQGYGIGDLADAVNKVTDKQISTLVKQYGDEYKASAKVIAAPAVKEAARIEAGMRAFLEKGGFKAFTTNFEDLHGLVQLPGLAVQRLMADGYGFGAEGDWKTAALVRLMKVMAEGLRGGTSFMEDYTYHLDPGNMAILGAHMLEVCPSIAAGKPSLEVHPLGIGGKADPARLVFKTNPGEAIAASLVEMGDRFRLIVNTMKVIECPPMPKLPVASVLWKPYPDLKRAATAWIYAGGAHHTSFSQALTAEHMADFADMTGIEYVLIDENCEIEQFRKELRWNDLYYALKK
ncbi:MAG TPA: L-arabinose isomerase [Bacteroidales bacterium]|jgi:L-arabinose isomerase|nr:L-arabinose isomerase [Bacteroidales bacterium]MDI9534152.1 L-arabinose isomerase [Bacteroidota bacterium]HOT16919.1 L-arabinose isomerase [Bacteroidales bacterium]HQB53352.1 L-arabinose isomerase [Bacteroidales bacterium]HQJ14708.1 L-arabinose isomerase [Bacteroidales bacterium]